MLSKSSFGGLEFCVFCSSRFLRSAEISVDLGVLGDWFGSIHIEGGHGCFPVNRNFEGRMCSVLKMHVLFLIFLFW